MDPAIVADVKSRLDSICTSERVVIPLAIESGSRAWGFPSLDSDYDCRFIYLRDVRDNLALFPPRDVIETPLTPIFDVSGWDLRKAFKLLLKGNAVVVEWLQSPIAYREDLAFRTELLTLANEVLDRAQVMHHYWHLLGGVLQRHFSGDEPPSIKKIFYALRPALALRQMRQNTEIKFPAMAIQEIMRNCELPKNLADGIESLVSQKAQTRELGRLPPPAELMEFVREEYSHDIEQRAGWSDTSVARAEEAFISFQKCWGIGFS